MFSALKELIEMFKKNLTKKETHNFQIGQHVYFMCEVIGLLEDDLIMVRGYNINNLYGGGDKRIQFTCRLSSLIDPEILQEKEQKK